jgi:hypothetical protein
MTAPWPLEVTPLGRAAAGAVLYRKAGLLHVTIIAKASFSFVPNGTMSLADPEAIIREDAHYDGDPRRSVHAAHDLSPIRGRADVIFAGHAYAPRGFPVQTLATRLAVSQGERIHLEKVLHIYGDRSPTIERPSPSPAPFTRMPIVYERAFGGHGSPTNPVGLGLWSGRGQGPLPNIVHPDPWPRAGEPAGYGPVPESWPARARLLGPEAAARRAESAPSIDAIDPAYFQAAPEDQRIDYLRGDEWILLENLNLLHTRMVMGLPDVRAEARLFRLDQPFAAVPMSADTLFIDGDAESCSVTWRGSYPLPDEAVLEQLRAAVGVSTLGSTIEWESNSKARPAGISQDTPTAIFEIRGATSAPMTQGAGALTMPFAGGAGTTTLVPPELAVLASLKAPFPVARPGEGSAAEPIPGAPWSPIPAPVPVAPSASLYAPTLDSPDVSQLPEALRRVLEPPAAEAAEPLPEPQSEPQPEPPSREASPTAAERAPASTPQEPAKSASWPWASPPPGEEPSGDQKPKAAPAARAPLTPAINKGLYNKFTKKKP